MNDSIQTTIPFAGFYNAHETYLDANLEASLQDDQGNELPGTIAYDLTDIIYKGINWSIAFDQYARAYTEQFEEEHDLTLTFEQLHSPSEYNFTTDVIVCSITLDNVRDMLSRVDQVKFQLLSTERFTSRSGFISFYSPDVFTWGPIETWKMHQVGCLIETLCDDWSFEREAELMESYRCNGYFEQWIEEAMTLEAEQAYTELSDMREKWDNGERELFIASNPAALGSSGIWL